MNEIISASDGADIRRGDLEMLFRPRSVAVLGASSDESKISGRPIFFLKRYGYEGPIYPVNPRHDEIQGLRAYKTLADIEGEVDLVLIALPAALVEAAIEDCIAKGVKVVVLFSAGFAETGEEGEAAQERLVAKARAAGMRLMGPNCMGLAGFDANMVVTFGYTMEAQTPKLGPIAIVSQSGAYGIVAYYEARERGLGVRHWATTGNESDIDLSECLAFCIADDAIDVVMLYMEGCKDGDRFTAALEHAQRAGKPVVVTKVGASDVGAEAAVSHTASITGSDIVFDTVTEKYGAHRARSMDEFYDVGYACATTAGFPKGKRVGLVTLSGGVGVLMSDAAVQCGLQVPKLPEEAQARIREVLPFAGTRNPVDVTGQALNDPSLLGTCLDILIEADICDILVVYLAMSSQSPALRDVFLDTFRDVREKHPDIPIIAGVYYEGERREAMEALKCTVIREPTRAVAAAAALYRFGRSFAAGAATTPPALPKPVEIPRRVLNEVEAKNLLAAAGLPMIEEVLATSPEEATSAVGGLDMPAALKLVSPDVQHKSEIGGVMLDVTSDGAAEAYETLVGRLQRYKPAARLDGVVVAPMITDGVETLLGVQRDPVFGPVVVFGLGGVFVEVLEDVARRLAPFDEDEAMEMIREIKGYPILEGVRGGTAADIPALAAALSRLSCLAHENRDRIDSIDINPFLVRPEGKGAVAVDALIVPRDG